MVKNMKMFDNDPNELGEILGFIDFIKNTTEEEIDEDVEDTYEEDA